MWDSTCKNIESHIGGTQSTEAWRTMQSSKTNKMEKWTGSITMDNWENHYTKLLTEDRDEFKQTYICSEDDSETTNQEEIRITSEESKRALRAMKNGRAPSPGGFLLELIKYGGDLYVTLLSRHIIDLQKRRQKGHK